MGRRILEAFVVLDLVVMIFLLVRFSNSPEQVLKIVDPAAINSATATAFVEDAGRPTATPDTRPRRQPSRTALTLLKQAMDVESQGPEAMEPLLREAVAADPEWAEVRLALAGVLGERGALDEAEAEVNQALELIRRVGLANPDASHQALASAHLTLASIYLRRSGEAGQRADSKQMVAYFRRADKELHEALQLDPDNSAARELSGKLNDARKAIERIEGVFGG